MTTDKLYHIFAGMLLMVFGVLIQKLLTSSNFPFWLIFIHLIGGGKELIYDKLLKKGNCELLDYIYTVALPTIIFIIIWIQDFKYF